MIRLLCLYDYQNLLHQLYCYIRYFIVIHKFEFYSYVLLCKRCLYTFIFLNVFYHFYLYFPFLVCSYICLTIYYFSESDYLYYTYKLLILIEFEKVDSELILFFFLILKSEVIPFTLS